MAIASDPLDALRTYIEHVAQDPDAPADERASRLQRLRDDLEVTLGAVDDYLGRALKRVEAERMIAAEDEQRVRDNATMREELLRTGVATERELDEAGFISQEEITRLEEEGLFEATVAEIASKWVQETSFAPQQHLRDRKGRFRDMPDAITHAIVPEGMGARTELATRKARTDMEFARDRALPVIVWAKGTSVTGNVRSVGAATVTIEDGDGTGHRIKWEDVERTVVRTADGARTTGFGRGERPRPASAPKPAATAPNTDPNASQKAHKYAEFKTPVTVSDAFYQKIDGIIRGAGSDGFTIIDREGAAHIVNYNAVTSIRPARGKLADLIRQEVPKGEADGTESILAGPSGGKLGTEGTNEGKIRALMEQHPLDWSRWKREDDGDESKWTPAPGVVYSPEVAKISSVEDTQAYLKSRGVDASLFTPMDTEQGRNIRKDVDFFRQIAQAVTDAQDRSPVLKTGQYPLDHVAFLSQMPSDGGFGEAELQGVWGVTTVNAATTNLGWQPSEVVPHPGGTWVIVNDVNQYGVQSRHEHVAQDGSTSPANLTPYGRMTHELGHAVYSAAGLDDKDRAGGAADPFALRVYKEVDLSPAELSNLSEYGASNMNEAWAEIYTTLHTPKEGIMDQIPEPLWPKLLRAQEIAQRYAGEAVL